MAANPVRGEADFGEHKLVVDFNGLCSLEAAMGKTVPEIIGMMDKGLGFSDLRTIVRVFIDADMGEEEVGNVINDIGYADALLALSTATNGFFARQAEGKKDRPMKAA